MKQYGVLMLIALAVLAGMAYFSSSWHATTASGSGDTAIKRAYEAHISDVHVQGRGTVIRVLPDDTRGERHQRFILRLPSGQTVLIAHNIDIAPRITPLHKGDSVRFSGVYEWNPQGGVIHWTHHDPDGRHAGGWLKRDGSVYQ